MLRGSEYVVSFKVLNYSFADISLEHLYNCNLDGTVIFGMMGPFLRIGVI